MNYKSIVAALAAGVLVTFTGLPMAGDLGGGLSEFELNLCLTQ